MDDQLINNLFNISREPVQLKACCFSDEDLDLLHFSCYRTSCISMKGISRRIIYKYKFTRFKPFSILKSQRNNVTSSYKQKEGAIWRISKNTN